MKNIRQFIALVLILCLSTGLTAVLAESVPAEQLFPVRPTNSDQYIIDSDTRQLTEEELWQWDRESMSYMFNEIFARHGFTFDPGGKFYNHFNSLPWYQNTPKVDNSTAYGMTTSLEWDNYHTIKRVIEEMEAAGHPYRSTDRTLLSWRNIHFAYAYENLTGFTYLKVPENQRWEVYSAPTAASWRGSDGKAAVSTNGYIYAAGWENGWLLIYYELTSGNNAGGLRVGYVNGSSVSGVDFNAMLDFSRQEATVFESCNLTDDPLRFATTITTIPAGSKVTYLTTMTNQNGQVWDYIETTVNGQPVRGFIPAGNIEVPEEIEEINYQG